MRDWKRDVADAHRAAYAERRALPIRIERQPPFPTRVISFLSGWTLARWLWRRGSVGKIAAGPAWVLWLLVALTLVRAVLPTATQHTGASSGYDRLGSWDVALTSWTTSGQNQADLDSHQFRWLVTHWKLHNPTGNALDLSSLEFSATSLGVDRAAESTFVLDGLHVRPIREGYLLPGQTATGDVVTQVFRKARTVEVAFTPIDGNENGDSEVYTLNP